MKSLQILVPNLTSDEKEQAALFSYAYRKLNEGYAANLPPVILSIQLYRDLYKMGNNHDPYRDLKDRSIAAAEKAFPEIERRIAALEGYQKLRAAIAAAIAGNLIDFNTAYHKPELDLLVETFLEVQREGFEIDDSKELWKTITKREGHAVILGDNAGETHLDIPLIEILKEQGWTVTYLIKAKPMINDATWEDIKDSRIPEIADVKDNGAWAHGVPKEYVSREFIELIERCDLVISKGQANVETFPEIQNEIGVETYYILRAKCPHISKAVGAKVGNNVVTRRG